MEVLESEKRQMNQQFEMSKKQKIEVVEDDVLLGRLACFTLV